MSLVRDRVPLLDVDVTALCTDQLIEAISGFVSDGTTRLVLGHNLHSVTLFHSRAEFRKLYERGDVVLLDGAPVAMLWGLGHGSTRSSGPGIMEYRLGSTDWVPSLGGVDGLDRIAVVGAGPEANARTVERLRGIVSGAEVVGRPGENWDDAGEEATVEWLSEFRPQLVLLGLGMPLQESVLHRRLEELPPAVYCTVGGAIEQLAGLQKLAPRWLGRLGLEWAWRLVLHPGRVAYRVFGEPWVLLGLLVRRRFSGKASR
ncbi:MULTISPECIES: WecB/TagA/CpsF family glycosyltransferase [Arthrobacter]|uniref:WecB/TagA/CpsF family glycosyltransferase n=1 Tax=Arthrobacter terricola TaxID=2547396 RepID=A0A4R5KMU4_9MICC|nr:MULTISPECIES: WecB/TagA/CpsF family glycosyltransferase [Arthrobacter]MBT8161106.1 WecB/TagA/CpsF family glycosyltransferase [Arthrobacter sp. GN70]TDF96959.1 WecB/TagA/CpsF family glycosyltransferase [Arthrobacter terricola]